MIDKSDAAQLMALPAFRRFVFALMQMGGVFSATLTEADGRSMSNEGRRSLVLDVLAELEAHLPKPVMPGFPLSTLIQTLAEQAQSAPEEKPVGRRRDQYRDLDDDGGNAER